MNARNSIQRHQTNEPEERVREHIDGHGWTVHGLVIEVHGCFAVVVTTATRRRHVERRGGDVLVPVRRHVVNADVNQVLLHAAVRRRCRHVVGRGAL